LPARIAGANVVTVAIPTRRCPGLSLLAAVAGCAALTAALLPAAAAAGTGSCPGTFRVLHDDSVGQLKLPAGSYLISPLGRSSPSCSQSAKLFARFLDDFDGVLPRPWRVSVSDATFLRAAGVGFHVARMRGGSGGGEGSGGSPGGGTANSGFCHGSFRVLHNDRIGRLRVPRGAYSLVLLQRRGLSCEAASKLLTRFLESVGGNLPRPWALEPQTASFVNGSTGLGFRIDPLG
jgi:hypothetical protein